MSSPSPLSLPDEEQSNSIQFGTPEALTHVQTLTDVGAMTRLLHECIAYQRNLDLQLENILSLRPDLDKHLTFLQKSADVLEIVKAESDHMLLNVDSTCVLADQVSGKVRELDLAQSRVNETLDRIDAIVERSNCIDGVQKALESEDFESAASFVQTFVKIDAKYKDSGSEQREMLFDAKKRLEAIVRRRLAAAVDQRDHAGVLRFIRLYSPLALEEEGLQAYVSYLNWWSLWRVCVNVRKAIKIDEHVMDSLTTSMVDDVFYVLQSCCRRSISTSNINSVIAALSSAVSLLGGEYNDALQQKMREPNLGGKLFLGGVVQKTGVDIATALNNIDVSSEYALKLRHEIEEQCAEVFPAPADRERIKSCLSELGEMSNGFKKALNAGLEQLVGTVTHRIRPVLDSVATVSYELSEAEYAENEVNDPWVQRLLHAVETNTGWLQPLMTANNYDSFVHLVIDFIVKRLEVIMMQKRFSQLGGLQLDRDVRALVSHFSGMTQRTVRDKFARLTQMATILNLEKVSEILDFWGENAGPMTWRLTPAEVRRVLGMRVDFKPEAIAALKL
ncbi:putative oligomeric Golgi complex, subunit 4 protein [Helianthus annuus]|nr:putative oligomeric Golgi complex, subunit 4 protein [Helianthus annuus]